jgi:predicted dehydrogenase
MIVLGKMGLSYCAILGAHSEANLIAVCDSSNFVLEAFNKYTNKATYTDFKKMLDENEIDALIVSTPTKYHYDMVKEAIKR